MKSYAGCGILNAASTGMCLKAVGRFLVLEEVAATEQESVRLRGHTGGV